MLEGIETGYEEKFDFPFRDRPPEQVYVLASVPRSGSTYLSHLLWRTGCLGAPLEYLNFLPGGHYGFASNSPQKQIAIWESVLRRRTSPNGVFGIKCFPMLIALLHRTNPALYARATAMLMPPDRSARVVRLRRRDRLAHAISYARAVHSGIWRQEHEPPEGVKVEYSREAVDHAMDELERAETGWDPLFDRLKHEPLTLWHEDVVADPDDAVRRVADFLGVRIDPSLAVEVPQVRKQAESDSRTWAERYRSQRQARRALEVEHDPLREPRRAEARVAPDPIPLDLARMGNESGVDRQAVEEPFDMSADFEPVVGAGRICAAAGGRPRLWPRLEEQRAAARLFVEIDEAEHRDGIGMRLALRGAQFIGMGVGDCKIGVGAAHRRQPASVREGRQTRQIFAADEGRDLLDETGQRRVPCGKPRHAPRIMSSPARERERECRFADGFRIGKNPVDRQVRHLAVDKAYGNFQRGVSGEQVAGH